MDSVAAEAAEAAMVMRLPDEPVQVNVPLIVWVVPDVNVTVWPAVKVRLLNVVLPFTVWDVPEKVTVYVEAVKLPLLVKFPGTVTLPPGANVCEVGIKRCFPEATVRAPPEIEYIAEMSASPFPSAVSRLVLVNEQEALSQRVIRSF